MQFFTLILHLQHFIFISLLTKQINHDIMCKAFCFTDLHTGDNMFEKDLNKSILLDFYGDILSEHKREILEMYYNEDFSLSEIAEEVGISRQGVRNTIKKAENELSFLEEKLGLVKRFGEIEKHTFRILELLKNVSIPEELRTELNLLYKSIK